MAMLKILWAHIRANIWCLFHFGDCVLTEQVKAPGHFPETKLVAVGRGSILKGPWETTKVFYRAE